MLENKKHLWYEDGRRRTSPEYRAWQALRNRCRNKNSRDYPYYGGRGIDLDPRWEVFANFYADMGDRPGLEFTLDRKNSSGNYTKENCRWATRKVQAQNRPYAKTRAWELAEKLGVKPMTAHHMIWQVRAKRKGNTKYFELSSELEAKVVAHLESIGE